MLDKLLNLSFQDWDLSLLFFLPGLIDLGIFIYAYFFLPQNRTNLVFAIFVLLLGMSQVLDGVMRLSASAETAMVWAKISGAPWVFSMPLGILFALRYTGWYKKFRSNVLLAILFFPAIVLELLLIGSFEEYTIVPSEKWNWIANPKNTLITNTIYLWISVTAFISFGIYWLYYFYVRKDLSKRNFSLLIAAGNSVPFIAGILAEVVFPILFQVDDIPITAPSIAVFSVCIFIAIIKYKALDFSPKHQWENILETMNEGMMIVNNRDEIMYANKVFCEQIGYEFHELKGKVAYEMLVPESEDRDKITRALDSRLQGKSSQYEILLKTKKGQLLYVLISGSPYLDSKGKVIGSIGMFKDISDWKLANKELELFIYNA